MTASPFGTLRTWLLAVLLLGLIGTTADLLLTGHYEDLWQLTPLVLNTTAIGVIVWHAVRPRVASVRALQVLMVLIMMAGIVGVCLHFKGAAGFQWEIDPSLTTWSLVGKTVRAKAPPILAPGLLLQLGLLGLVYSFFERTIVRPDATTSLQEDLP